MNVRGALRRRRRPLEVTVTVPDWSAPAQAAPPAADGLSPFTARVLDQLSLTAWLPAALVIANAYLLIGMYLVRAPGEEPTIKNLEEAVSALNDKPIGVILAVFSGVVIVTLVTQSLEFAAIRFFEGYWGGSIAAAIPTWAGVKLQRWRLRLLDRRVSKLERKAFEAAAARVERDLRDTPALASATLLFGCRKPTAHLSKDLLKEAQTYYYGKTWMKWSPPHLRHRANSLSNRRDTFPRPSRLMPTRLGNVLRTAEDQLTGDVAGSKMRGYLYEHLDRLGPALMQQHNQYRNRLDMYAVMTALCLILAAVNAWLLPPLLPPPSAIVVSIAFLILSYASYRGAVSAALDYGPILIAMDRIIAKATSSG